MKQAFDQIHQMIIDFNSQQKQKIAVTSNHQRLSTHVS